MSFEAPITAPAGVPRVAHSKNYGETEIYRESDIDGEAALDVCQNMVASGDAEASGHDRVSVRQLGRQSSVLYPWRVPQACCI